MRQFDCVAVVLVAVSFVCAVERAQAAGEVANFDGEWRTSVGVVVLKQTGDKVTGAYGANKEFTPTGTVDDRKLTFEYQEGTAKGDANWTLDDTGNAFSGGYQIRGGRAGRWEGWRPDPDAINGETADLSGLWLTNLGLMELEQTADKVKGRYAVGGASEIEGTVKGRRFDYRYKAFRPGAGWFDFQSDLSTFAGAAVTDGFHQWYRWHGRRAPEFVRHVTLTPGKIVDGATNGLLTYSVRAPDGFDAGDGRKWPAIVILHGSNMNGRAYVATIASAWPDVARDYVLIGINGERPSSMQDEPRFNYTYINYVGRSTFKGFPGTDRESPALVAEALDELRDVYPISKYFVGGHSQGGFLTYSLLMNFPEKIAGAFPISAGVIFQCEPSAYEDESVRAAQRSVPLAIIHGRTDPVVPFSSGEYAATLFGEAGWPAFRFFADNTGAGHMFARLPVDKAIRWLEAHASDDPVRLLDFAEERMKEDGGARDAITALKRAHHLMADKADQTMRARLVRLGRDVNAKAIDGASRFAEQIANGQGGEWVDEFLAYRDAFEFAPAAREVMQKFGELRAEHEPLARKAINEARAASQQGNRDGGYAKYQEVVDKYYASSSYRNVKRWLAERK